MFTMITSVMAMLIRVMARISTQYALRDVVPVVSNAFSIYS